MVFVPGYKHTFKSKKSGIGHGSLWGLIQFGASLTWPLEKLLVVGTSTFSWRFALAP